MGPGQPPALGARIRDTAVPQGLAAEVDHLRQEITQILNVVPPSRLQERPVFLHALLCLPISHGRGLNPTDLTEETTDEDNFLQGAQEQAGQLIIWTHMSLNTTTAMIAQETRGSMALQIPTGVHRAVAITDVSHQGEEAGAPVLEMGVEVEVNACRSEAFFLAK